jgi:hypothetical protein
VRCDAMHDRCGGDAANRTRRRLLGHHRHRRLKTGTGTGNGLVARMASSSCMDGNGKISPAARSHWGACPVWAVGVRRLRSGASPCPCPPVSLCISEAMERPPSRAGVLNLSLAATWAGRSTHLNDAVANPFPKKPKSCKGHQHAERIGWSKTSA